MEPFCLDSWPQFAISQQRRDHPQNAYIDDVTIDSRTIRGKRSLFIALEGRRGDGHMYVEEALNNGARYALVRTQWQAPSSVSEDALIRVDDTLGAMQDLAGCIRRALAGSVPVVAIGGCTGKTMVKDLIRHLFRGNKDAVYTSPGSYNSQIGVALSLINIPKNTSIAFIEVAADKPGEMQKLLKMVDPTHAVITNFFRPRYGIGEANQVVVRQLVDLVRSIPREGWVMLEQSDLAHFTYLSYQPDQENIYFWNAPPSHFPEIRILSKDSANTVIEIKSGPQEVYRVCVASTHPFIVELIQTAFYTCHLFGVETSALVQQLLEYTPQTIRTEVWKSPLGTTFINGPYSHEALSFAASLEDMAALLDKPQKHMCWKRALIFGGLQHALFDDRHKKRIMEAIHSIHISNIFYWPAQSKIFLDEERAKSLGISLTECANLESAISQVVRSNNEEYPFHSVIFKGAEKASLDWLFQTIEDSPPQTYASINLASIRHNIDLIKSRLGPSQRLMIMVKALAYGTDDIRIAHFLRKCGIDILGVSYVDEGVGMRKRGVEQDIFVINAMPHEMVKAAKWNLEVGVGSMEQIEAASRAAQGLGVQLKVHLHVDTGMKRFGCRPDEAELLARAIINHSEDLYFEGLFTHFCSADDPSQDEHTLWQANTLSTISKALHQSGIPPKHVHAANSAAAFRFSFSEFSMSRIGLATYGMYTSAAVKKSMPMLRPALSLVTRVAGLNRAQQGDTVSYGRAHTIKNRDALIAVLPIGYYDGLHRRYSEKAEVLIRGKKAPMIGKICMDYMMVDVSHIPDIQIGDSVLIFGEDDFGNDIPLEEFAERGGSIAHELMTCLGPRIQRLFIYDESLRTR